MTRQTRTRRIRLAFEPNRFSCEQLERAYEQLKPVETRATTKSSQPNPEVTKRRAAKRGER